MTDLPTEGVTDVLASAADGLYEVPAGLTFPGIYGALAKAHMDRYETSLAHLAKVGIKNHTNGALNPKAQFNTTLRDMMERRKARAEQQGQPVPDWQDEMDFLNDPRANPWIAWPLRLYDCAPITDGASCVLLVSAEIANNFTDKPVHIAGTGQASGRPLHDAEELTSLSAAREAAAQAYAMAGSRPGTSRWPRSMTVSPSPRSSPPRTWASSSPARVPGPWTRAAPLSPATGPSILPAA